MADQEKALYSGRKGIKEFAVKKARKNRKPKDTPEEIHNLFDEIFYKKFRIKLRSESIFTSSNQADIHIYGDVYFIFPVT